MATSKPSDLAAAGRNKNQGSRLGLLVVVACLVAAASVTPHVFRASAPEPAGLELAVRQAALMCLKRAGSAAGLCLIAGFLAGQVHRSIGRVYLIALILCAALVGALGVAIGACAAYALVWGTFIGRGTFRGTSSVMRRIAGTAALHAAALAGLAALVVEDQAAVSMSGSRSGGRPTEFEELFQEHGRIEVSERDLNLLLESWIASLNQPVAAELKISESEIVGAASFAFDAPWTGTRYVNVAAASAPRMESERFDLNVTALSVGQIPLPAPLVQSVTQFVITVLESQDEVRAVLASIENVQISAGMVEVRGPTESSVEGLARSIGGEHHDRQRLLRYMIALIANCSDLPETEERFCGLIEQGFRTAREATQTGSSAADENRAALVALAIQVGDPRVRHFVGFPADEEIPRFHYPFEKRLTLRGRNDLARHFFVSAAMYAIAGRTVSDTAGLFKEQLDSVDGGSGFSFADLAADRAGARFAALAVGSEESARDWQRELAAGFTVEDLMPAISGLPEGLTEDEVQQHYGGVNGKEFQRMLEEIDRRLDGCRLLSRRPAGSDSR